VIADGCNLPFRDDAFDLAFSNSVVEHVADPVAFAREIIRVGRRYYVQTPSRWFPVEPHLLTPLIHYLPMWWRSKLLRHFTVWGLVSKPDQQEVDDFLSTTHLLSAGDMRTLFPHAQLVRERFLGLTKSVTAWGPAE